MSAYVVGDHTINTILSRLDEREHRALYVAAFPALGAPPLGLPAADAELGAALRELNERAVLQRYPDCSVERGDLPGPHPYLPFRYAPLLVDGVQAYKSLLCLLYQMSEGDVPETPLYRALETLSNAWARDIVCKLGAYDAARWG